MRNRFKLASFAPFCDQNRPKRKLDNLRILLPDSLLKRSDFQTEFEFPFSSFARSFFFVTCAARYLGIYARDLRAIKCESVTLPPLQKCFCANTHFSRSVKICACPEITNNVLCANFTQPFCHNMKAQYLPRIRCELDRKRQILTDRER